MKCKLSFGASLVRVALAPVLSILALSSAGAGTTVALDSLVVDWTMEPGVVGGGGYPDIVGHPHNITNVDSIAVESTATEPPIGFILELPENDSIADGNAQILHTGLSNNYFNTHLSFLANQSFTIAGWARVDTGTGAIFSVGDAFTSGANQFIQVLADTTDNRIEVRLRGANEASDSTYVNSANGSIGAGEWFHYALVRDCDTDADSGGSCDGTSPDDDTLTLYLNGQPATSVVDQSGAINPGSNHDILLGGARDMVGRGTNLACPSLCVPFYAANALDGAVGETFIWSAALNHSDVLATYLETIDLGPINVTVINPLRQARILAPDGDVVYSTSYPFTGPWGNVAFYDGAFAFVPSSNIDSSGSYRAYDIALAGVLQYTVGSLYAPDIRLEATVTVDSAFGYTFSCILPDVYASIDGNPVACGESGELSAGTYTFLVSDSWLFDPEELVDARFLLFGIPPPDSDGDGIPDSVETTTADSDGDGVLDYLDLDSDNNGIPDSVEAGSDPENPVDTGGSANPDFQDADNDGDGILDILEIGPYSGSPSDFDGNGVPDYLDATGNAIVTSNFSEENSIPNPDIVPTSDQFGYAVDSQGSLVLVGAWYEDAPGYSNAGRAYLFDLNSLTPTVPIRTFDNPTPAANDNFGVSVRLAGDDVLIGAWRDDNSGATDGGAAYLYDLTAPESDPPLTLQAPSPSYRDRFGYAIDIEPTDKRVIVGAYGDSSTSGKAYLFNVDRTDAGFGDLITQINNPVPENNDKFGVTTRIEGDTVLIGAVDNYVAGMSTVGQAYVFKLDSSGQVMPSETLIIANPDPSSNDRFGDNIDLQGNFALIGAALDDLTPGDNRGRVYLFSTIDGALLQSFANPLPAPAAYGRTVRLQGNKALISAESGGKVYVYSILDGSLLQTLQTPHLPPPADTAFGRAFVIEGSRLVVGDQKNDDPAADSGYVFVLENKSMLDIDILPGFLPDQLNNVIHPHHDGRMLTLGSLPDDIVPVTVFGASIANGDALDFDTSQIDPTTVRFGPAGGVVDPASTPVLGSDLDGDGVLDAQFEFKMSDMGFGCSDTEGTITGETHLGEAFDGMAFVDADCDAQCHL